MLFDNAAFNLNVYIDRGREFIIQHQHQILPESIILKIFIPFGDFQIVNDQGDEQSPKVQ